MASPVNNVVVILSLFPKHASPSINEKIIKRPYRDDFWKTNDGPTEPENFLSGHYVSGVIL